MLAPHKSHHSDRDLKARSSTLLKKLDVNNIADNNCDDPMLAATTSAATRWTLRLQILPRIERRWLVSTTRLGCSCSTQRYGEVQIADQHFSSTSSSAESPKTKIHKPINSLSPDSRNKILPKTEDSPPDHREIGNRQKLFTTSLYSPGSPLFLPDGAHIFNKLIEYLRIQYDTYGFHEVIIRQYISDHYGRNPGTGRIMQWTCSK